MRLLSEDTVRALASATHDPRRLGSALGADVVVPGVVQPAEADSVEGLFRLSDGHDPRYAKSLRHAVPRSGASELVATVTLMVTAGLDHRESTDRSSRTLTIPPER